MKAFFLAVAAFLAAFSAYVFWSLPHEDLHGRTRIYWETDLNPLRDEQVALFEKLHPGIALGIDPNNAAREKVIVQSLAGVGPDVFDYWGYPDLEAYVDSGVALDLTDELKRRGIDYRKIVWPMALPWTVKDGRIYGVPANVGVDGVWFHKDMFRAAGVPFPKNGWTVRDFIETAEKMTVRDSRGRVTRYGALIDFGNTFYEILASFGGEYWNSNGTESRLDSRECVACLTFLHDLLYKYKVAPTPGDENSIASGGGWGGSAGPQAYFRRRVGAMAIGGRWWLAQLRDDVKLRGFQLGSVTLPIAKYPLFSGGARSVMVNSLSAHRKESLEFIAYLLERPYNELLNDQADALSAVRSTAYEPRYEHNARDPGQDFHPAFRTMNEMGYLLPMSPFVPSADLFMYIDRQLDLVKLDVKTPAQALRDAKRDITQAMLLNVSRDPSLKARFDRLRRSLR